MKTMNEKKQMEIQEIILWLKNGDINYEGTWDYRKLIDDIHELAKNGHDVRCLQVIFVWALNGYFKFWKKEPEFNKTHNKFEEFNPFFEELSEKIDFFDSLNNDQFSSEIAKKWCFFK